MSNKLDADQDRHSVSPDLVPNCLQKLSADDTGRQELILISQIWEPFMHKIMIIFLPISLNICFGCSKELSHRESTVPRRYFKYPSC